MISKNRKYLLLVLFNFSLLFIFPKIYNAKNKKKSNLNLKVSEKYLAQTKKTNIDLRDEFFQIEGIRKQIKDKNITYLETISGGFGNVGNALIMLNNLINICEKIGCKNIITPQGLQSIIKKPIFYQDYNITIFPSIYKNNPKSDITIARFDIFYFHYRKKKHEMRLNILREEIFRNIPKYNANINDLYINIRSGDIFVNIINPNYAQPPLCFYQKIIIENHFNKIFILSNGHENPVVGELLRLYPNIKFIHGSINYDISVIVNAYNLVMPISTFPLTLFRLNTNLKNIYIYEIISYNFDNYNATIHVLKPSPYYSKIMRRNWKNSKEQLDLMIHERCINSNFSIFNNQ